MLDLIPTEDTRGRVPLPFQPLLMVAAVTLAILIGPETATADSPKPNVIFILADDLGYGDVECFGLDQSKTSTPNFNELARQGMRFTNAYSIASVCVPSRVSVMTGRYAFRFGKPERGGPWGFLGPQFSAERMTLARMLGSVGYRTGYVGKWHLGTRMTTLNEEVQGIGNVDYSSPLEIGPPQYGLHDSFILPGSLDMFPYAFVRNNHWVGDVSTTKGWSAFARMGPAAHDFEDTNVLNVIATQAEQFIQSNSENPFFLYVGLTAPHTPVSPSKEFAGKSEIGIYGDFVMNTDAIVGRVMQAIEIAGLSGETLIIASSDHGPASYAGDRRKATKGQLSELKRKGHSAAGPFRGYKFSIYEGAFRVPFVARWPGKVPSGSVCDKTIGLIDLMATLGEIADVPLAEHEGADSISFVQHLIQSPQQSDAFKNVKARDEIFLQGVRGYAYRHENWKIAFCPGSGAVGHWGNEPASDEAWREALRKYGKNPKSHLELERYPFVQLFDLEADPGETRNLAFDHPKVVQDLVTRAKSLIDKGRSTEGRQLTNDRVVKLFQSVPRWVWQDESPKR